MNKTCETCNCIDDEEHRLNTCPKWENNDCNLRDDKVPFIKVYSNDCSVLRDNLPHIQKLWDTKNAQLPMDASPKRQSNWHLSCPSNCRE